MPLRCHARQHVPTPNRLELVLFDPVTFQSGDRGAPQVALLSRAACGVGGAPVRAGLPERSPDRAEIVFLLIGQ
jgi:hypothetical protein